MYVVAIAILSILLAFPAPPLAWRLHDPALIFPCVALATLLPPLIAVFVSRRAVTLLERHPDRPGVGQESLGRGVRAVNAALVLLHGAVLCGTDWMLRMPFQTLRFNDRGQVADIHYLIPGAPGALAGIPFILSILLVWTALYPSEQAIRRIALENNAFAGKPVHPVWSLPHFVIYNFRHQVAFVLAPMALILVARDWIQNYDGELIAAFRNREAPSLLLGIAAVLVAVISPLLLRYIWATRPLPAGPLRDRLLFLCARLKMRCREILVWHTGGMMVNAAVMGVVAPLRYVLITDGMLEQMDDTRIEAVFGHETGHVKRHHIIYFLLFAMISGCLATVLLQRIDHWPQDSLAFQAAMAGAGMALVLKWGLLFGWVSRNFERQADLYGVRTLQVAGVPCGVPCAVHGATGDAGATTCAPLTAPAADAPLCQAAANIFSATLNEVAVLNGIPPEQNSWRHGSISRRSMALQEFARHREAVVGFERRVRRTKAAILAASVLSAAWAGWEIRAWTMLPGSWGGSPRVAAN
jgi:STE24 endopeptidase